MTSIDPRTAFLSSLPDALEQLRPTADVLDAAKRKLDEALQRIATAKASLARTVRAHEAACASAADETAAYQEARAAALLRGEQPKAKAIDESKIAQLASDAELIRGGLPGLESEAERAHLDFTVAFQTFRVAVHELLSAELQRRSADLDALVAAVFALQDNAHCEEGLHAGFQRFSGLRPPEPAVSSARTKVTAKWSHGTGKVSVESIIPFDALPGTRDGKAWIEQVARLVRESAASAEAAE